MTRLTTVRKLMIVSLISGVMLLLSVPAFASNYSYEGVEQANFGRHTEVEDTYQAPTEENVKKNKDSNFVPPTFGSRTADTPETGELLTPNISGVEPMRLGGTGESLTIYTPSVQADYITTPYNNTWTDGGDIMQSDGSIGRLEIPAIGINVKVYEGENNISKGAGHFTVTSAWGGNTALAGHNRGVNAYFGRIHELQNGDAITYSTILGTRRFTVFSVMQVDEYDTSCLYPTANNIITLVTCVRDVPSRRWVVQARADF